MRRTLAVAIALLTFVLVLSLFSSLGNAEDEIAAIWTDKANYHPEETVIISGSGFEPGASVFVTILRPLATVPDCADPYPVLATETGSFSCTYLLDGVEGFYTVTATDGVNTATTQFRDGTWMFYGWNWGPQPGSSDDGWNSNDLKGYNEGDAVAYKLAISPGNKDLDMGKYVGYIEIQYGFYRDQTDGLTVDYLSNFKWAYGENVDFDTGPDCPAVVNGVTYQDFHPVDLTMPVLGVHDLSDSQANPAADRYFRIPLGSYGGSTDGIPTVVQAEHELVFYFQAHLALTIVWQNCLENQFLSTIVPQFEDSWGDPEGWTESHLGSGYYNQGSASHFWLNVDIPGASGMIPIPIPPGAPPGTISGHKWNDDVVTNGQWDEGETGVPNWPMTLHGELDMLGQTVILEYTTLTDSSGAYSFAGLPYYPGTEWTVTEGDSPIPYEPGWTASSPTSVPGITIPADNPDTQANEALVSGIDFFNWKFEPATITVYKRDTSNKPLDGWTMELAGPDPRTGTTGTNGPGCVIFTVMKPGDYTISEVLNDGWTAVSVTPAGTTFTVASGGSYTYTFVNFDDVKVSGCKYDTEGVALDNWEITLRKGGDVVSTAVTGNGDWPAGYYEFTITSPGSYSVSETLKDGWTRVSPGSDYSFSVSSGDADKTGLDFTNFDNVKVAGYKLDTDGVALDGWTVTLLKDGGGTWSATTGLGAWADGYYEFIITSPGSYTISETVDYGWTKITPVGDYVFGVVSGAADRTNLNFVNFEWAKVTAIKHDANTDPVEGWEMSVGGQTGDTGADGAITFWLTLPGAYTLSEEDQTGWTHVDDTTWAFTALSGGSYTHTFVNFDNVKVSGFKFDTNGIEQDGWEITLSKTGGSSWTVTTGAGDWEPGYYEFVITSAGSYTVSETLKSGWTRSSPETDYSFSVLSGDADKTNLNFVNFDNVKVTVKKTNTEGVAQEGWTIWMKGPSGEMVSDDTDSTGIAEFEITAQGSYEFTEVLEPGWTRYLPASGKFTTTIVSGQPDFLVGTFVNFQNVVIHGTKYDDKNGNGNGIQETGEPGLVSWLVVLTRPDGTTSEALTSSIGYYEFTLTSPGTYTVEETMQPGWMQTYPGTPSVPAKHTISNVKSGEVYAGSYNFGNFIPVDVTVYKYTDITGNGLTEDDTVLPGWGMSLYKDGGLTAYLTGTTDVDGMVLWTGLGPGSYSVGEEDRYGWTCTGDGMLTHGFGQVTSGGSYSWTFTNFEWVTISGYKYEVVFADNFEDAAWTAANWHEIGSGDWVVHSGVYTGTGGAVPWDRDVSLAGAMISPVMQSDFTLSVKVRNDEFSDKVSPNQAACIPVRYDPANDNLALLVFMTDRIQFQIDDGGDWIVLGTAPYSGPTDWHELKIVAQGDRYDIYLDDMNTPKISTVFHATKLGQQMGVWAYWGGGEATFDDFCVGTPLSGWEMRLYDDSNPSMLCDWTTTDAQGHYEFLVTDPGTYSVAEVLQEGWTAMCPVLQVGEADDEVEVMGYSGIALRSGVDVGGNDFCNFEWATVTVEKQDYSTLDGLPGWKIYLAGPDPQDDTTDADGLAVFTVKKPGVYTATEAEQEGYTRMSAASFSTSVVSGGNYYLGPFTNFKWATVTVHKQEYGGGPLGGWQITLVGPDGSHTGTTAYSDPGKGSVSFVVKLPGLYVASETLQPRWTRMDTEAHEVTVTSGSSPDAGTFVNFHWATICGRKFIDMNGDGVMNDGDSWKNGWTIYLYRWTGTEWVYNATKVTATDGTITGRYCFDLVLPTSYQVRELLLAEWTMTCPILQIGDNVETIKTGYTIDAAEVTSAAEIRLKHFGNFQWLTICGRKFIDVDGDGIRETDSVDHWYVEDPGWTMTIYKKDKATGLWGYYDSMQTRTYAPPESEETITGRYCFLIKEPGDYQIREDLPAGWTMTFPMLQIGDADIDMEGVGYTYTGTLAVRSGTNIYEQYFGNFQWAEITVTKHDTSGNLLDNWDVSIDGPGSLDDLSGATGDDGAGTGAVTFIITHGGGNFVVSESLEDGWTAISSSTNPVAVSSGGKYDFDFVNFEWATITVYKEDTEGDPLSWGINLAGPDPQSGSTDSTYGKVEFTVKKPGDYDISEVLAVTGWTLMSPDDNNFDVTVASGGSYGDAREYTFVNFQWATITVYKEDTEHDPLIWDMNLFGPSSADDQTGTTDATYGKKVFTVYKPGAYYLEEETVSGWTRISPTVNRFDITVQSGGNYGTLKEYKFVNFQNVVIQGTKYNDKNGNGNGIQETGEPGLGSWIIVLTMPNGKTSSILTNSLGHYEFTLTAPGIYTVEEMMQPGWMQTYPGTPSVPAKHTVTATSGAASYAGTLNFGNFVPVDITVWKYTDITGDGLTDDDTVLPGWGMSLYKDGGLTPYLTGTTNDDGMVYWSGLGPGNYYVQEEDRYGWTRTGDGALTHGFGQVTSGGSYSWKFTNFEWVTISGYKYEMVFCDDFETGYADGWTSVAGDWYVVDDGGNMVYSESSGLQNTYSFVTLSGTWSDFVMQVTMKQNADNGYDTMNIIFRETDSGHFYMFSLRPQESTIRFYKKVGYDGDFGTSSWGQWTQLSSMPFTFSTGTWYSVKLTVEGSNFKGEVGSTVITATDSDYTAGKIGLMTNEADVYFDDVCIRTPLSGWTMELYDESDMSEPYMSTPTNSFGYYEFVVVDPGVYSIAEVLEAGWTALCPVYQVGLATDSEVFGYTGIALTSGIDVVGNDFCNFEWVTLSGAKFFDANGDGARDDGEPGLDNWAISIEKDGSPYLPSTTTASGGLYSFVVKDPGRYVISETMLSVWWTQTAPEDGTFTVDVHSGHDVSGLEFGNWLGGSVMLTDTSYCVFDFDSTLDGRQFKLIFTPDMPTYPNLYRLTASNPGQFYVNVFFVGDIAQGETIQVTLPYPFVTQGANPVHVYSALNTGPCGCLIPVDDISWRFSIDPMIVTLGAPYDAFGDTKTITLTATEDYSGFAYVTVHLDYGMKKNIGGLTPDASKNACKPATSTTPAIPVIVQDWDYSFSAVGPDGEEIGSDTVSNTNTFKRDPGFGGLVLDKDGNPVQGVKAQIYRGTTFIGQAFTDEDGWYMLNYKHTGKAVTYSVSLEFTFGGTTYHFSQLVTVKANSFSLVSWNLPIAIL